MMLINEIKSDGDHGWDDMEWDDMESNMDNDEDYKRIKQKGHKQVKSNIFIYE